MKTFLPLQKFRALLTSVAVRMTIACLIALGPDGGLYAANAPLKRNNGSHLHKTALKAGSAKRNFTVPTVSYTGPINCVLNNSIIARTPTSSGVGAPGYTAAPVPLGSGFNKPSGITADASGNIFVADYMNNAIKEIPAGGGAPVSIGSGFIKPVGIAVDSQGNLYITLEGSAIVYQRLKVNGNVNIIGSGFSEPMGLAVDMGGNVYVADHFLNKVFKVPAGNGTPVAIGTGFVKPYAVAVDAAGDVFVADNGNNAVKKIAPNGTTTTTIATGLNGPSGVAVDNFGNVFVDDFNSNAVKEIAAGTTTAVAIGTGFLTPYGVAVDGLGNLFVADYGNNAVEQLVPTGGYYISPMLPAGLLFNNTTGVISGKATVTRAAQNYTVTAYNTSGYGTASFSLKVDALAINYTTPQTYVAGNPITALSPVLHNTVAAPAFNAPVVMGSGFSAPVGVAVDASGNIFVADYGNNVVKKIWATTGTVTNVGSGFNHPSGVAVDAAGNVYVADSGNNAVKRVPAGGGAIVTLGASFLTPMDVKVDAAGNVFVADKNPNSIKEIPAGTNTVITISKAFNGPLGIALDAAGNIFEADINGSSVYEVPVGGGPNHAIGGGLNNTKGVAVDGVGNLYVTEYTNNDVARIAAGTQVVTIVATGLNHPEGITIDAAGNLYVVDQGSTSVKKISPAGGYFVSPALPAGLSLNPTTGMISGTPVQPSAAANYIITAYNSIGTGNTALNIKVNAPAAPAVSYATPQQYIINTAVTPLAPAVSGVASSAYNPNSVIIGSGFNKPESVAIDAAGNIYVVDNGNNQVKKIPAGGGAPVMIGSGFLNPSGVAVDAAGNVYVADFSNAAVKKIPAGGGAPVLVGSGFMGPMGVTLDAAGNLYVADFNANAVFEIAAGTNNPVPLGSGFNHPSYVAVDGAGNVYVSDSFNDVIKKIPAGNGTPVTITPNLSSPYGIAVDAAGNLFVAERDFNDIREFPAGGGAPFTVGTGFINPYNLALDATGNLYVADYGNNAIKFLQKTGGYYLDKMLPAGLSFDSNTGIISGTPTVLTPAANYTITGANAGGATSAVVNISVNQFARPAISYSTPDVYMQGVGIPTLKPTNSGGPVAAAAYSSSTTITGSGFSLPTDVITDAAGNIYVADRSNNAIKKIPAGGGAPVIIGSGFNSPSGVAVDAAGNVYVADEGNNLVKRIPVGGGSPVAIGSGFNVPFGVAVDAAGNVYVADYGNNAVKVILAGSNTPTAIGSGFLNPTGVAVDAAGNIYVADYGNNAVKKMPPGGGTPVTIGSGFSNPADVAVDPSGNVFVADNLNNAIKEIPAGSNTPVIIGSGFFRPFGVAIDPSGNVLVADFLNSAVKQIAPAGGYYASALPAGLRIDNTTGYISGTPIAAGPAANYTITAYNLTAPATAVLNIKVDAPKPDISYTTPNTFAAGMPVTLSPVNTGGPIPATTYSQVTTLAGSGAAGSANGTGAAATFENIWGMDTDAAGNIYVADLTSNLIRKITPGGVVTTFAGSGTAGAANGTGTAASFKSPSGIAVDASGNIFVADAGNNLIRKITPGGVVTTFAGSGAAGSANGTGTAASFKAPRGMVFDGSGNLFVADYSNNLIRKITPAGVVTTFAGSGAAGAVNGTGTAASFSAPAAIAADASGNLYVAEYGNNLIRKITSGGVVTTFAGSGTAGAVNGNGTSASFKNPFGITSDAEGNLYVADRGNALVRKITPAAVVTTLAGTGSTGSVNGTGTGASFNDPRSVAVDGKGNLYVGDYGGHQVRKVIITGYTISPVLPAGLLFAGTTGIISGTPTTAHGATNYSVTGYAANGSSTTVVNIAVTAPAPNISYTSPNTFTVGTAANLTPMNTGSSIPATIYSQVTTLAGSGAAGAANGTGMAASFNNPWGMATDASGNIYVADYAGNLIRKVTPAGVVTTFAGSGTAGSANGTGTAASFKNPSGLAVDAFGNVFVADAGNNMIREITPGGVVTTFAGSTTAGSANGTGTAATFHAPRGMAFDNSGNLYVADYSNNLIRKITPGGVVSTLAGSGTAGSANGTGTAASFSSPAAVAADAAGNVFVVEYGNNLIRKITPGGVVTTFAGSGAAGSANGTGTAASFKTPFGITIDALGNLYIADRGNAKIRKITPGAVVTTLAGTGANGSANGTGTAAQFNDPRSLAADASGNLYVGDFAGNQVRKILLTGYTIDIAPPAGLSFAATTGIISGTPTAVNAATNYTITGYNALGSSTAVVNIAVVAMGGMAAMITETPLDSAMNAPVVKQGLSPNGDGVNDVMIINNIEKYPENRVTIMNTAGVEIYQVAGYDNQNKVFDGRSSKTRALQKPGTYFYRLEYTDNGKPKYKTGYILLKY